MTAHSSILAWEIPWTEVPGGLESMGLQGIGHDQVTKQQSQTTGVFLPGSDGKRIYLQCRRPRLDPWVEKVPRRSEWLPTPVFSPREFYEQREKTEGEMVGWYHQLNGHDFVQTLGNREAWHAAVHGVTKNQTWLSNWTMKNNRTAWNMFHI